MILEMKDICKDYIQGKMVIPVLKNICFDMEEGEYVAVMGPSGSGKTTLMNLVGCLDQPTSGTLILDGQDISKCTDNEMSDLRLTKIGFVFQNFQLLPRQTALENVELPLTYANVPKREKGAGAAGIGKSRTWRQSELYSQSVIRWSEAEGCDCAGNCQSSENIVGG